MKTIITEEDFIKSVKKADREIELQNQPGFKRITNVHKSKKKYDRRRDKKISPFLIYRNYRTKHLVLVPISVIPIFHSLLQKVLS